MRCNILLPVISPANWRILLLVPPISCPHSDIPQGANGAASKSLSELSSVLLWISISDWPIGQNHLYTWPGELYLFCHVIFLLISFIAVFLSFLWFPVKYSILSLSKHCLLTLMMPCPYSVRQKKVEMYVTEIEAQRTGSVCFLSQQT